MNASPQLIQSVQETRDARRTERDRLQSQLDKILDTPTRERRDLTPAESSLFDSLDAEIARADEHIREATDRIDQLQSQASRLADSNAAHREELGLDGSPRYYTKPSSVYQRGDRRVSFFADLRNSRLGDIDAMERLRRNEAEVGAEARAGDMTTVAGAGGEFAPPAWLLDEFVKLARPGRVFADRCNHNVLPPGVSTINLPKVSGGTTTAVQATQNSQVSDTAMTTTSVSSGITTIVGQQILSRQIIDQNPGNIEEVVLGDLAADYAKQLDLQVLAGSGSSGQLDGAYTYFNASGTVNFTYTQASPSVTGTGGFYSALNHAISQIATGRFAAPTCVVMAPRRWSWIAAAFDSQNRPLVVPSGAGFNNYATADTVAAQGIVGEICGLPVYTDPNIATNLGGGTNQDPVYVMKADDLYLYESSIRMESFDSTYANQASVLLRCLGYSAFVPSRYTTSLAIISGTGLVTPTY